MSSKFKLNVTELKTQPNYIFIDKCNLCDSTTNLTNCYLCKTKICRIHLKYVQQIHGYTRRKSQCAICCNCYNNIQRQQLMLIIVFLLACVCMYYIL